VKSHFLNKCRDKQPLLVFCDPSWRKLRNLRLTKCKERARRTGQRITTPKVASADDNREAMANACFWLGTAEAAEFHGLNVSVCHLCGRGREVSTLKPEDLGAICMNEDLHSCNVTSTTLQHDKAGPLQELSLYPHSHSLQEDPHFGFICSSSEGGCNKADWSGSFNCKQG